MFSAFPAKKEQLAMLFMPAFLRAHSTAFADTSIPATRSNSFAAESANIPTPQYASTRNLGPFASDTP